MTRMPDRRPTPEPEAPPSQPARHGIRCHLPALGRRPLLALATLAVAAWLGGCGPSAAPPVPDATGSLRVTVVGLPEGVPADVTLNRDGTDPVAIAGSTQLDGLAVGRYTLLADAVCAVGAAPCADADRFLPADGQLVADVTKDTLTDVEVPYACALVAIPDGALATVLLEAVRSALDDPTATLSCANLAVPSDLDARDAGIADLEGLQHARGLRRLDLRGNPAVVDLTPIAGLAELVELGLGADVQGPASGLDDLAPIANLAQLERLDVVHASVRTLPALDGLDRLRHLAVEMTPIEDLGPVADLPDLLTLSVSFCRPVFESPRSVLSDLTPLAGLTGLTALDLGCQSVSDLTPIAGLTMVQELRLRRNLVATFDALAGLAALTHLDIGGMGLTQLDLAHVSGTLRSIDARLNWISDLRPLYLHAARFGVLEEARLEENCIARNRVPNAGYVANLQALGVSVETGGIRPTCASPYPTPALSTFEVDAEGWTTAGDAVGLRRIATGGPLGGAYLEADDGAGGVTWWWDAPPHFLGDASSFFGGDLEYELRQSDTTSQFDNSDVILEGAGRTLTYRHGSPIGTNWTRIAAPLSQARSGDGWQEGGQPVDEAALLDVLGDVTRIRIRGEYRTGADTGGLGRVRFGSLTD